jgi:hypothetical protein
MSTATTDRPEACVSPKPQRDANGRFARGNSGGPGNPFGRRLAQLRECLLRSATDENIERLANMLMERAFAGDMAAAKLLLLYWIGKPKDVAEPDRVEVEEWELAREHVVRPDVAQETFASMPVSVGIATLPALAEVQEKQFVDMMRHPEKYPQEKDDEPTPEELAEEAEMLREMRAAREQAAPCPAVATSASVPTSAACLPRHDASGAAGRSPSPNGDFGRSETPVLRTGLKTNGAA